MKRISNQQSNYDKDDKDDNDDENDDDDELDEDGKIISYIMLVYDHCHPLSYYYLSYYNEHHHLIIPFIDSI